MIRTVALFAVLAVAACSDPAQQAAVTNAAVTLATVAAANNTTVADIVTKGGLFCASPKLAAAEQIAGIVAVQLPSGQAVSVTNQGAAAVAATCAALGKVPVPAPADPSSVPMATVASTLPPT